MYKGAAESIGFCMHVVHSQWMKVTDVMHWRLSGGYIIAIQNKCWPACYIMSINHTIFLEETCYNTGMGTSTSLYIWLAPSVLHLLRNFPCYNLCIHKSSSTTPSATTTTVSPYILFATRFSIYRMNIDGSEKQLVVREPAGGINAVNYHYRYG